MGVLCPLLSEQQQPYHRLLWMGQAGQGELQQGHGPVRNPNVFPFFSDGTT